MIDYVSLTGTEERLQAQYLVCGRLVRACREVMYEIALEENGDPQVRHRAIQILKDIHREWVEARRIVRRELAGEQTTFTHR